MSDPILVLLVITAAILWLILPVRVAVYRSHGVVHRIAAIQRSLVRTALAPEDKNALIRAKDEARIRERTKKYINEFHSWKRYWLPFGLMTASSAILLTILLLWFRAELVANESSINGISSTVILALLGGYVWSLWEVLSRADSHDLTPHELYDVSFKMIASAPIGYAFSLLVFETVPGLAAFVAAAFPAREIRRIFQMRALHALKESPAAASNQVMRDDSIRATISGVSDEDLIRLGELRIGTYIELAYTDPLEIMVRTGFQPSPVLDWIDQALWYIYVGPKKDDLRRLGVGTAVEASNFYETHCLDNAGKQRPSGEVIKEQQVIEVAEKLELSPSSLIRILEQVYGDPYVENIQSLWGSFGSESDEEG